MLVLVIVDSSCYPRHPCVDVSVSVSRVIVDDLCLKDKEYFCRVHDPLYKASRTTIRYAQYPPIPDDIGKRWLYISENINTHKPT